MYNLVLVQIKAARKMVEEMVKENGRVPKDLFGLLRVTNFCLINTSIAY